MGRALATLLTIAPYDADPATIVPERPDGHPGFISSNRAKPNPNWFDMT
jgi:hypothetical protein